MTSAHRPLGRYFRVLIGLGLSPLTGPACTGDTVTDSDSATPVTDCDCGGITTVTAGSSPGNVLARNIRVGLDAGSAVEVTCTLTESPGAWHQFVTAHADWQYLDDGSDPASGWREAGFAATGWSEGRAPLGYADEFNTELSLAGTSGDVSLTAWFRVEFDVDDPGLYDALELSWLKDDGVMITLNGTEVARDNLPSGTLTSQTGALEKLSAGDEDEWHHATLDGALLITGTNVLAAEVHQYDKYSEDLSFDARFVAWKTGPSTPIPETHTLTSDSCATDHELPLHGLLADATYTCQATTTCGTVSEPFEIQTDPLPDDLPRLAPQHLLSGDLSGTYTLFTHTLDCAEDYTNRLIVTDPEGQIRWYWEHPTLDSKSSSDIEAELLPDGTILVAGGEDKDGRPITIGLDGEIVYEAGYDTLSDHIYHHDIQYQDGQFLGLVEVKGDDPIEYFGFVRLDPATDTVTWEWDNRAAHDAATMPRSQNEAQADDPYHANSLAGVTDADGPAVYVSLLHANAILRIDETTGEQSWVLSKRGDFTLVDTAGQPLGTEGWFNGMHAIDVWDDRLWVYDNGWDTESSRALMYTLDTDAMTAELTFEYTEAGWKEPVWGDADELESGNVLVNMGHVWCKGGNPSHQGALVELDVVTAEPIWRVDFLDPDDASYRAQRVGGCDLFSNSRYCPE